MKSFSNFKIKDLILLIIILVIFHFTNSSLTNFKEKLMAININQEIKSVSAKALFDKQNDSCDLFVQENVRFTLQKPSNTIYYIIFSKRFSYYGFSINVVHNNNYENDENLHIVETKFFSNTNFRKLLYNTLSNNELNHSNFKENWVLSVQLSKPVSEVELQIKYNVQNGLFVDPLEKKNIFQFEFINPYSYPIDKFDVEIEFINFPDLNSFEIKTPDEGRIKKINNDSGLKIYLNKKLPEMSQYSVSLPLPYSVDTCNRTFTNIVNLLLYSATFLITIMGVVTCFKVAKD